MKRNGFINLVNYTTMKTYIIPNTQVSDFRSSYMIMQSVSGANLQGVKVDPEWEYVQDPR